MKRKEVYVDDDNDHDTATIEDVVEEGDYDSDDSSVEVVIVKKVVRKSSKKEKKGGDNGPVTTTETTTTVTKSKADRNIEIHELTEEEHPTESTPEVNHKKEAVDSVKKMERKVSVGDILEVDLKQDITRLQEKEAKKEAQKKKAESEEEEEEEEVAVESEKEEEEEVEEVKVKTPPKTPSPANVAEPEVKKFEKSVSPKKEIPAKPQVVEESEEEEEEEDEEEDESEEEVAPKAKSTPQPQSPRPESVKVQQNNFESLATLFFCCCLPSVL